ncbi:hypothetical protein PFISCL1PPCAC_11122, partial [Pristionchus fissidentatus]
FPVIGLKRHQEDVHFEHQLDKNLPAALAHVAMKHGFPTVPIKHYSGVEFVAAANFDSSTTLDQGVLANTEIQANVDIVKQLFVCHKNKSIRP